jgi:selenocysteine lyase/cysteine desulfurase
LLGTKATNIAFAQSATEAYARALSAVAFAYGDVVRTTRDDYVSNQIAFLSLREISGSRVLAAGLEPLFIDVRGARWAEANVHEAVVATAARFED